MPEIQKDYAAMSDEELRAIMAATMGWDTTKKVCGSVFYWEKPGGGMAACLPRFFTDANDLREVRLWAWEKHEIEIERWTRHRSNLVGAYAFSDDKEIAACTVEHDSTRPSIIRAEARATIIAVLKAINAKEVDE